MTQLILGTAGHIDHGKTALIKALTNVDLDRLKEEKERGITIELGFTSLPISPHLKIGVIDVPGHEKFVKRMIAGAGGVDMVILVVAADDGVMPQTREHLDICQLLGIKHGLIAITKIDLVDPEWLELVKDDINQLVKGTFLQNAPLIPVSPITKEGIPELISAIQDIALKIDKRTSEGLCFLPIDRVFTMKGFGTVVTGTLISGEIRVGEIIEVLPVGIQAKVRRVQVHNKTVEASLAGQRTAVNLQGVEKESLRRGDVLSYPDMVKSSQRFDVRLRLLANAPQPLKHGDQIRLHLFTTQTLARVISYEGNTLEPEGEYNVQLRFSDPLVTIPGARFIIRNPDATQTIGGGEILDPHPPKHRRDDLKTKVWFQTFLDKNLEAILNIIAQANGIRGITKKEVFRRVHGSMNQIGKAWNKLHESKTLVEISPELHHSVHREVLLKFEQKLQALINEYHIQNPLKLGIYLKEARQRLGKDVSEKLFERLIQEMKNKGEIACSGEVIYHPQHKIALSPEQLKLKNDVEAILRSQGLTPPTVRELIDQFSTPPEIMKNILDFLLKEGVLVKIKDELYFYKEHINQLKKRLIEYFKANQELTPGDFKKMTGISRKYLIPLLEYFDREKVTLRIDGKRILRDRKVS